MQLSPQVFDLLDRIFVVDEDQRITVKQVCCLGVNSRSSIASVICRHRQIRKHPWFDQPPAAAFSAAVAQLAVQQKQLVQPVAGQRIDQVSIRFDMAF